MEGLNAHDHNTVEPTPISPRARHFLKQVRTRELDYNQGGSCPMIEVEDHERIPICQFNK